MDTTTVLTVAVGVLALCVVVLAVLVVRLFGVVRSVGTPATVAAEPPAETHAVVAQPDPDYVITRVGLEDEPVVVPDRVVLSATLGEPLVKAIALGHGVRRALGAEARNRIRFEMRREVKRARKDRRREMRDAWRQMRTEGSPMPTTTVPQQRREDVA